MRDSIRQAARYLTVPLYWLTIAVCVAVLVVSLVLWPRSYFAHDYWPLGARPWRPVSTPALRVTDERAQLYSAVGGVVSRSGALCFTNLLVPSSWNRPFSAGTVVVGADPSVPPGLRPINPWSPAPFPGTVPYWLSLLVSCGVLAACAPAPVRARWRVGATRFGLKRLLAVTACAGLLAFGYRGLAVPGVVIAGEAILLAAIGRGVYDQAVACRGAKRWAWFALVLVCGVAIGVLAGFFASNPLTNLATNGMVLPNP